MDLSAKSECILHQGLTLSREQLTVLINANARAYIHPVCELIRKDIIKSSPAIIMDESTLYVRETANRKIKEGKSRKSQIWTLNTGWTAPFKASWYSVSDSRSADNVISILGEEVKDNDILKYLISDGYTGYPQKSVIHNFNSTRQPIKYAA